MAFYNPFHAVIENKKYPLSQVHRSNFTEKLWATFKVFSGNYLPDLKNPAKYKSSDFDKMHFGIFDIPTLGILFGLSFCTLLLVERKFLPIKIIGIFLTIVLASPRVLFAAALTLISLPLIIFTHWCASFKGDILKNTVLSHQVANNDNNLGVNSPISNEKVVRNTKTISRLLEEQELNLNDIQKIELKKNENPKLIALSFFKNAAAAAEKPAVEIQLCLHDKTHRSIFKALKKLNIGGLQAKIELDHAKESEKALNMAIS